MSTAEWGLLLGVIGTVTAVVAAVASAINIYKNRAFVRVSISQFMPTDLFPHWALAITGTNHGWRTVTLDSGGLEFEDDWTLVLPLGRIQAFFPIELPEGKSHKIWFTADELRDAVHANQVRHGVLKYGFFRTATGKKVRKRLNGKSSILEEAEKLADVKETSHR